MNVKFSFNFVGTEVVVGISGNVWEIDRESWKNSLCSNNFKRLDQAIISDVARALINIPIGIL